MYVRTYIYTIQSCICLYANHVVIFDCARNHISFVVVVIASAAAVAVAITAIPFCFVLLLWSQTIRRQRHQSVGRQHHVYHFTVNCGGSMMSLLLLVYENCCTCVKLFLLFILSFQYFLLLFSSYYYYMHATQMYVHMGGFVRWYIQIKIQYPYVYYYTYV